MWPPRRNDKGGLDLLDNAIAIADTMYVFCCCLSMIDCMSMSLSASIRSQAQGSQHQPVRGWLLGGLMLSTRTGACSICPTLWRHWACSTSSFRPRALDCKGTCCKLSSSCSCSQTCPPIWEQGLGLVQGLVQASLLPQPCYCPHPCPLSIKDIALAGRHRTRCPTSAQTLTACPHTRCTRYPAPGPGPGPCPGQAPWS